MKYEENVLIISRDRQLYDIIHRSLLGKDYNIYFCGSSEDVLSFIEENNIKVVILDYEDNDEEEFNLLKNIKAFDSLIDVIIVGELRDSEEVADWINWGATEFLNKRNQIDRVQTVLKRISEKRALKRGTLLLENKLEKKYIFQGMIGKSPYMLDLYSLIENIANYFTTVLITGDTGTGKEMAAKAIHNLSPRKNKRFVVCDCVSIPENLFESELFGYVKGAFTGADRDKKGLFEEAHGGIIFLDEIGDVPVSIQAKLLRVLETHRFRAVGYNNDREIDVRVIAATNLDLRKAIKNGTFREDLFYRLSKIEIHLPPLCERPEDISILVRYFLKHYTKTFGKTIKGVSRQVQKLFLGYHWPGNVRELENAVESSSILCKRDFIDIIDLPKYLQRHFSSNSKNPFISMSNYSPLSSLERDYILYLLKMTNNNKKKTAEILNISRSTLYQKINKYNISIPPSS